MSNKELFKYIVKNDFDKLKILIEENKEIDVNHVDELGIPILHYANNVKIAKLLVSYGADIHKKDKQGNIALHKVASQRDVFDYYVSLGCDISTKNIYNQTPRMLRFQL